MPPVLYIARVKVIISVLCACFVLSAAGAAAQTLTAGVVKDESGGVISGATVLVTANALRLLRPR